MAEPEKKPFGVDFIDPLFAVAIHIGFVDGIMHEKWFVNTFIPTGEALFNASVFLAGLTNVVLSWVGYHQSINLRPIRGLARFILDIVLVLLYAVLLVKFREFGTFLLLMLVIYIVFIFWDVAKVKEYEAGLSSREFTTIFWAAAFAVLYALYCFGVSQNVILALVFASMIAYRFFKNIDIFSWILRTVSRLRSSVCGSLNRTLFGRG